MATIDTDNARTVFEAAGLKGQALDNALSGLANMRTTASIAIEVAPEGERKYGDVLVYKQMGSNYRKMKMGLRTNQLPEVLDGLAAAFATLDSEGHAAWVATVNTEG